MALSREEKEQIVTDLQGQLTHVKAAVVTHYRGLTVEKMEAFRQKLREEKISYHVVKNTLMKKASQGNAPGKAGPLLRRSHGDRHDRGGPGCPRQSGDRISEDPFPPRG